MTSTAVNEEYRREDGYARAPLEKYEKVRVDYFSTQVTGKAQTKATPIAQILEGTLSSVSKPIFGTKGSLCNTFFKIYESKFCTLLHLSRVKISNCSYHFGNCRLIFRIFVKFRLMSIGFFVDVSLNLPKLQEIPDNCRKSVHLRFTEMSSTFEESFEKKRVVLKIHIVSIFKYFAMFARKAYI